MGLMTKKIKLKVLLSSQNLRKGNSYAMLAINS